MSSAYFVSDIHLKTPEEGNAKAFVKLLKKIATDAVGDSDRPDERPTHLFLVGDIFDLWIGSHAYFIERFRDVVEAVEQVVRSGVEVHFFEGNHDLHLRGFWEKTLGVRVHSDAEYFHLSGKVVRVEHGDLINPEDKGYLFLRAFLRSVPMTYLALHLPSKAVQIIGERASRASRRYTSSSKSMDLDSIRKLIRTHAEKCFSVKPFDILISGHVHVADDAVISVGDVQLRSVNLGSWYEPPRVFVMNESGARFVDVKDLLKAS